MIRAHHVIAAGLATAAACATPAVQPTAAPATATTAVSAATATPSPKPLTASVEIRDKDGAAIGTATLTEQSGGVRIVLTASKLSPGHHGWHLHAVGKCDPPDFASAGGHFNPGGRKHGSQDPDGAHAGDLGNLSAQPDGSVRADVTAKVTLGPGASSLFDADGTSIVLHAAPDDERTDPSGNSGARIACGVVRGS